MLKLLAAFALATAPAHAAAQDVGDRTVPLADILAGAGAGNSDEEIARAAAAASAYPFGTPENPARVGGPDGERAYLARLRCVSGAVPQVGPRASAGVGAFGSVVGAYPLACGDAAEVRLIMDMYHEGHDETRAPAGFTLSR